MSEFSNPYEFEKHFQLPYQLPYRRGAVLESGGRAEAIVSFVPVRSTRGNLLIICPITTDVALEKFLGNWQRKKAEGSAEKLSGVTVRLSSVQKGDSTVHIGNNLTLVYGGNKEEGAEFLIESVAPVSVSLVPEGVEFREYLKGLRKKD